MAGIFSRASVTGRALPSGTIHTMFSFLLSAGFLFDLLADVVHGVLRGSVGEAGLSRAGLILSEVSRSALPPPSCFSAMAWR